MTPIESILYMIWRGIAVGILISAPMGPVGILCIQRTLDKGRKAGFYTGIGAAISDLFYCLLTGFGLSFIEGFLNENQNVIQLIGSVVLIAFSIYLFKKNPSSALRRPLPQNVSAKKNILGGFLFTFSNPLIIFLIIGLFARFNFTNPDIKGYYYAVGYLFIIAGALGWWYGITFAIDKIRCRFSMRSMKKMNVAIGIVILGFACVGIVTSILGLTSPDAEAAAAGIPPAREVRANIAEKEYRNLEGSVMRIPVVTRKEGEPAYFRLDLKLRNVASAPMKRYEYTDSEGHMHHVSLPVWGFMAAADSGDTLRIGVKIIEHTPNAIESQAALKFSAEVAPTEASEAADEGDVLAEGVAAMTFEKIVTSGVSIPGGWNHYRILMDATGGLTLLAGERKLNRIFTIPYPEAQGKLQELAIELRPGAAVEVKDVSVRELPAPGNLRASLTQEELQERFLQTSDPIEGRWKIFDESMQESLLRLGGDYELGMLRVPNGSYEIIYLAGAETNGEAWKPGMLKGRLTPGGIATVYDLEWVDAFGATLSYRLKAQREADDLLTLQFPYHESKLRLYRLH